MRQTTWQRLRSFKQDCLSLKILAEKWPLINYSVLCLKLKRPRRQRHLLLKRRTNVYALIFHIHFAFMSKKDEIIKKDINIIYIFIFSRIWSVSKRTLKFWRAIKPNWSPRFPNTRKNVKPWQRQSKNTKLCKQNCMKRWRLKPKQTQVIIN